MMDLVVCLVDLMLVSFTERHGNERNFRSMQFFDLLLIMQASTMQMQPRHLQKSVFRADSESAV